jgi:hypothetical protein
MKTPILLAVVVLSIVTTMTSCKKDYVCKCSKTYTGNSSTVTSDYSQYTYKDTRKKAEDRCNANADSGTDFLGNYSVNCQIQ